MDFAPESINGSFNCSNNELVTLKGGIYQIIGSLNCSNNNLETLESNISYIQYNLQCSNNKLKTLYGIPRIGGKVILFGNPGKYLDYEMKIRKKNPLLSEEEIFEIMLAKTNDDVYINKKIKDIFLF